MLQTLQQSLSAREIVRRERKARAEIEKVGSGLACRILLFYLFYKHLLSTSSWVYSSDYNWHGHCPHRINIIM
jgi:hypothetical protein